MRHVVAALAAAACMAGLAADAAAEVTASASMSPRTVVFPATRELVSRLELRTGDRPETFAVEADPPWFEDRGFREGSPVGIARVEREGDVSFGTASQFVATPACSPVENRFHGYDPSGFRVDVTMPANAAGAIVLRRPFGDHAPWPSTELRSAFRLTNDLVGPGVGTLESERTVMPPAPARAGPTGVLIRVSTRPETGRGAARGTIAAGAPIVVTGSTDPPLPGAAIELRWFGPESQGRELAPLARVELDDAGRFELAGWRPRVAGYHELWAFYRGGGAGVTADHACPRRFELAGSYDPPPGPGALKVRSRSARPSGFGAVPLRITCTGGGGCDAKVTLRTAGGRRIARRRVVLGVGLSQRVFFPLSKSWRRALARSGRLRAVAEAGGRRRSVVLRPRSGG